MEWPLFDFVLACGVMGLGIGADVAIATLLRAQQLNSNKTILFWVVGVSLTHTLFPMFGYLLTYFSIQVLPLLTPIVGVLACGCIAHFLWHELRELATDEDPEGMQPEDRNILVSMALILAVSWDALWSGPAKSAQVIGWPELLVWLSFVIVGAVVALFACLSLYSSKRLQVQLSASSSLSIVGQWVQYSIIAYFGLLALLRYTLALQVAWWQVLLLAAGLMFFCLQLVKQAKRIQGSVA